MYVVPVDSGTRVKFYLGVQSQYMQTFRSFWKLSAIIMVMEHFPVFCNNSGTIKVLKILNSMILFGVDIFHHINIVHDRSIWEIIIIIIIILITS